MVSPAFAVVGDTFVTPLTSGVLVMLSVGQTMVIWMLEESLVVTGSTGLALVTLAVLVTWAGVGQLVTVVCTVIADVLKPVWAESVE